MCLLTIYLNIGIMFQFFTLIYNYQQHIFLQNHSSRFQVKNIIILNLVF